MKIIIIFILLFTFVEANINAPSKLAQKLNLFAGTKAAIQWERVFSSKKRMDRYNISKLPKEAQNQLKTYLINHAADSDQPIVPGL